MRLSERILGVIEQAKYSEPYPHVWGYLETWAKQAATLEAEIEQLCRAIATPEVYAGVISEVVERERDELQARVERLEGVLGEIACQIGFIYPHTALAKIQVIAKDALQEKTDGNEAE